MTDQNLLLPFQRSIIEEVLERDTLCVLAPGLGLQHVVVALLRLQEARGRPSSGVTIILGASPYHKAMLANELTRQGACVPPEITSTIPLTDRERLYMSQASVFVTTRIFLVDVLSKRIGAKDVAGVIVLNAHKVTDTSAEGFSIRLVKQGHPTAFVRAFTDSPAAFTSDFGKVEKVVKALHVSTVALWPRFQVEVQSDLQKRPPELIELSQPMTTSMVHIYEAISIVMDSCVKELKKSNTLDTTDLTASSGLLKSFDENIRRQLTPIWHIVPPKTKQLISDLKTLRHLAVYLLRFDPVTYLSYLDTLRATECAQSVWIFHSAAHTLFEAAKARVYELQRAGSVQDRSNPKRRRTDDQTPKEKRNDTCVQKNPKGMNDVEQLPNKTPVLSLIPVLEQPPKWSLLLHVLEEIAACKQSLMKSDDSMYTMSPTPEIPRKSSSGAEASPEALMMRSLGGSSETTEILVEAASASVLVTCADSFTLAQLRDVLIEKNGQTLMLKLYRDYLQTKIETRHGEKETLYKKGKRSNSQEYYQQEKRHVTMGGMQPGEEWALRREAQAAVGAGQILSGSSRQKGKASLRAAAEKETVEDEKEGLVRVREGLYLMALDTHDAVMIWKLKPSFIIIYDPDPKLIRQIELFKAQHPGWPLLVYVLRYEDSVEMDRFQAAMTQERKAFESLIKSKEMLTGVISGNASNTMDCLGPYSGDGMRVLGDMGNALTRRAGGRSDWDMVNKQNFVKRDIVIDVREFMSNLPAVLHAKGLRLFPVTLEVGDYVLSPEICVERKTIPDLKGSLASGRLYTQMEAMTKHYKIPVLLIEFDADRMFALEAAPDIQGDVQLRSLMSKIALLCLHFPRIRMIWSRSLHATADIFLQLKAHHEEPDLVTAATVGVPLEGRSGGLGSEDVVINQAGIDVLRMLPGVNETNVRPLMQAAGSLAGLVDLSCERLAEILGGSLAARKLRDFIDMDCSAIFKTL